MSKTVILERLRTICTEYGDVHRNLQFERTDEEMAKWCGASVRMVMRNDDGYLSYGQIKSRLDTLVSDGLALKIRGGPGSIAFYWPRGLASEFI